MSMRVEDFSTRVIRAVPVDITLSAVQFVQTANPAELDHWEPVDDGSVEVVGLVFTAGVFADVAEKWGSLDGWMEAISGRVELRANAKGVEEEILIEAPKNPLGAIVQTLALVLHRVPEAVGAGVSMQSIPEYSAALMAAMQIAQGVDPTFARRIGKRVTSAKLDPNAGLEERLAKLEADSLSTPGAGSGVSQDETLEPSGD